MIVVNDNYIRYPWADYLYASDERWWKVHYAKIKQSVFKGELWTNTSHSAEKFPGLQRVPYKAEPGLSLDPSYIHSGGNSGYQAIGMAYRWGAAEIVLLGFDMQVAPDGRKHWFGDHPPGLNATSPYKRWVDVFGRLATDLAAQGVRVINCSMDSALDCFEKKLIQRVFEEDQICIRGMKGLGDNIYQRAFIKQIHGPVLLQTPWPELYSDLPNVQFVKPATRLRTQQKNIMRQPAARWRNELAGREITVGYRNGPIIGGIQDCFGFAPGELDLPELGPSPILGPYAVIRPVTLRSEWPAASRNPLPQYIAECAVILRKQGLKVITVADLKPGEEWLVGEAPEADIEFSRGELNVRQLLALVRDARVVVGGIGWLLPAAIAAQVPGWFICGGQGAKNAPEQITSSSMNLKTIAFAMPDNYCRCSAADHNCRKEITHHAERFAAWLKNIAVMGT